MAIIVPILTQFDERGIRQASREFQKAQGVFNKSTVALGYVGTSFQKIGSTLTKTVTPAIIAAGVGIYKMTQLASNMAETQSKVGVIFGDTANDIRAFGKTAARSIGQSEQAALDAASTFGIFGASAGLSGNDLVKFSKQFTVLASDFASFYNTSPEDAILAIGSALRGEALPLRRYGVLLNEAELQNQALKLGLISTTKEALTPQIKILAAAAFIMEKSKVAQGDFARTAAGLANQQRILNAEVTNLSTAFGGLFLPIMTQIVLFIREQFLPRLSGIVEGFKKLEPEMIKNILKFAAFLAILGPTLIVLGTVIRAVLLLTKVFAILNNTILRIPLAIALLIGLFAAQNDAQYKLAKDTGDSWGQISRLVVLGIRAILFAIDRVIDGFKFIGFSLDFAAARVDNFFDTLVGRGRSMMSFEQMMEGFQFSNFAGELDSAVAGFAELANNVQEATKESTDYARDANKLAAQVELLNMDMSDLNVNLDQNATNSKDASTALQKLKKAAQEAAQAIVDKLETSLQAAEDKLNDLKNAFASFKGAIGDSVKGILNFGTAIEEGDFFNNLTQQAKEATDFATKVKTLIQLGLSERGIRAVLETGYESGSKIADAIIAGGATMVQQVNELLLSVDIVAEEVGNYGAGVFYNAGIAQGQALADGIRFSLESAKADLKKIMDEVVVSQPSLPTVTTPTIVEPKLKSNLVKGTSLTKTEINKILTDPIALQSGARYQAMANSRRFAKGGIVTGPTNALIGEAGPEAVIPLSGGGSGLMGATYNIVVNAGVGTNGAQVGAQIVEAIKKYERTSGQVFARA
jgi:hypothetical protein